MCSPCPPAREFSSRSGRPTVGNPVSRWELSVLTDVEGSSLKKSYLPIFVARGFQFKGFPFFPYTETKEEGQNVTRQTRVHNSARSEWRKFVFHPRLGLSLELPIHNCRSSKTLTLVDLSSKRTRSPKDPWRDGPCIPKGGVGGGCSMKGGSLKYWRKDRRTNWRLYMRDRCHSPSSIILPFPGGGTQV